MPRHYQWDPKSAFRKASSNVSVSAGVSAVVVNAGVSKQITGPHDPQKDAYRNCTCGKHINLHKDGKCP